MDQHIAPPMPDIPNIDHAPPVIIQPKPKLLRFAAFVAVIAVVIGFGAGFAFAPTATAPGLSPQTVTETVDVEVAPQACLDALDIADESFLISADSLTAIINGNYAEASRLTKSMDAKGYNRAKADCRAAA